ncbi:hypothetical protein AXF22_11615 [Prevotella scopos JCM 17725]|nr:hypothetical protein AXF22_11615 [Prevotella scopos JCM 17725]
MLLRWLNSKAISLNKIKKGSSNGLPSTAFFWLCRKGLVMGDVCWVIMVTSAANLEFPAKT